MLTHLNTGHLLEWLTLESESNLTILVSHHNCANVTYINQKGENDFKSFPIEIIVMSNLRILLLGEE